MILYTFQVPQSVIRQRLQITRSIETYAYPEIISICDLCVVMDRQGFNMGSGLVILWSTGPSFADPRFWMWLGSAMSRRPLRGCQAGRWKQVLLRLEGFLPFWNDWNVLTEKHARASCFKE